MPLAGWRGFLDVAAAQVGRLARIAGRLAVFGLLVTAGCAEDAGALGVMTYNVRYANENKGEAWATRRPLLAACIRSVAPDVIGTQEGLYRQLCDVAVDRPRPAGRQPR
jgi:hypothetical protein